MSSSLLFCSVGGMWDEMNTFEGWDPEWFILFIIISAITIIFAFDLLLFLICMFQLCWEIIKFQ